MAECHQVATRFDDDHSRSIVDRLDFSLLDLSGFSPSLALKIDVYLHQQGIDTATPDDVDGGPKSMLPSEPDPGKLPEKARGGRAGGVLD
jgi:hypothetical protein